MTIDDEIRDEKLQYDINRETGKISASSPEKIDKCEYLTGEEILPSEQSKIIEQEKFTYSPLGEAFETQIKTTEDQGEKQIKSIEGNKKQLNNKQQDKHELLFSKEREIFKDIYNKRVNKIDKISNKNDYGDLKFIVNSTSLETDFSVLKNL